jgi:uncharacterized UBP type Zn finger protein
VGEGTKARDKPGTEFYSGNFVEKSSTGFTGLANQGWLPAPSLVCVDAIVSLHTLCRVYMCVVCRVFIHYHTHIQMCMTGATCYLNSFIQSLYMTPEFRSAVYSYEWDKEEPAETCIGLQLQKLFARLQISDKGWIVAPEALIIYYLSSNDIWYDGDVGAVTTSGLTKSFGWDSADVFTQQDVQEMFHVLFEAIERTCVGSKLSNTVSTLYRGFNTDFVHCQHCNNFRGREDTYLDLGLTVEGTGSLNNALDAFIKTELLEGKNAYHCTPCASKRTAEKGLRFSSFPYILSLQLQRFKMNWQVILFSHCAFVIIILESSGFKCICCG